MRTTTLTTAYQLPLPHMPINELIGWKPLFAGDGTRAMLVDGSIWEYKGISAYEIDNENRIKGWERVLT